MDSSAEAPPPAWPAEIELLLACARPELSELDLRRAEAALDSGIDESRLIALAKRHYMIPLLHAHVSRGRVPIANSTADALALLQARIVRRNLRMCAALTDTLRVLESANIQALPLKGPVLAQQVYGSIGLRSFLDLDVLVPEAEFDRALRALTDAGCRRRVKHEGVQRAEQRHSHHVGLVSSKFGVPIEVHRTLFASDYGHSPDLAALCGAVREMAFMGVAVPVMDRALLLVYLCRHGAAHAWQRIEWIGTAATIARAIADWDEVWRMAVLLDGTSQVRSAVQLFDSVLAPAAAPRPEVTGPNRLVLRALAGAPPEVTLFDYQFQTANGAGARVRRLWNVVATPHMADAAVARLPGRFSVLLYVVRPVRLVWRAAARVARRFPRQRARIRASSRS